MNLCKLTGYLYYSNGDPVESAYVYAVPALSPAITSSGYAINPYPVYTYTSSVGYFELNLIQDSDFVVTIPTLGFRQKITVPVETTYDLFNLSSLPINNEVIPPTPNPNW